jgi:hypothetical protein
MRKNHENDTNRIVLNWSLRSNGAIAYPERLFGRVWVDGTDQKTIPIDGVKATSWPGAVTVSCRGSSPRSKI